MFEIGKQSRKTYRKDSKNKIPKERGKERQRDRNNMEDLETERKKWIASESTVVKQNVKESVRYDAHLTQKKISKNNEDKRWKINQSISHGK